MKRRYSLGDQETLTREMDYYNKIEGCYEPLSESDYNVILSHLPDSTRASAILEVGCGSGAFGQRLERRFASPLNVGLDVSFNLLCRHPFAPVLGNGQSLPFQNESFDLIAASAALHHIHNLPQTLAEMFRCLKPSGRVIFIEPNADHPYRRIVVDGGFLRDWFLKTTDESVFPTDLVAMLQTIGYTNIQFQYVTFQNRRPSLLGRIQWWITRPRLPRGLERFVHAWFVLVSEK